MTNGGAGERDNARHIGPLPSSEDGHLYLPDPPVAMLLGSLILHEAFGPREILGLAIILAAMALVQLWAKAAVPETSGEA